MRIVYIDYEFPGLTTTFTWREVAGLRDLGVDVRVISVRQPQIHLLPSEAKALQQVTTYHAKPSLAAGLGALVREFIRHPRRVMRSLVALASPVSPVGRYPAFVFHLLWASSVAETVRAMEPDLIHAPFAAGQGSMALFASYLTDVPLWITSHAYDIYADRIALARKIKESALFVTISDANKAWLIQEYGAVAESVRVIHLGIDPDEIPFRARGAVSDPARLVSVGSLNPKKGHDVLIKALSELKASGMRFECRVVGQGPLRQELETLAGDLGLADEVEFLGAMSNDQVRDLLDSSDLFVLACRRDGSGNIDGIPVALMEAMASGVPVVSTRLSGIPELVIDGETGALAVPDDPTSLAAEIRRLVTDLALRDRMSVAGRAHVEERFNAQINVRLLAAALEQWSQDRVAS